MLPRIDYLNQLTAATARSPVTALLGPRQCGKTTLAREFAATRKSTTFDLESEPDIRRLANPELVLGGLEGLVVLDEIQQMPQLFAALRVLVDRPEVTARFLILGSASPELVRGASESLAGRVEFIELAGFDLGETGEDAWRKLWLRGGLPRSYLAASNEDSAAWRDGFIRTFLERDIPQLGITVPAPAMRRRPKCTFGTSACSTPCWALPKTPRCFPTLALVPLGRVLSSSKSCGPCARTKAGIGVRHENS